MTAPETKTKLVKPCPCCNGNAEWVEVKTQNILLWQLACNQCGMATDLDEKKSFCLQRWNKRTSDNKAKTGWMLVILLAFLLGITAFTFGLNIGTDTHF